MVISVLPAGKYLLSATKRFISVWAAVKHSMVDKQGKGGKKENKGELEAKSRFDCGSLDDKDAFG